MRSNEPIVLIKEKGFVLWEKTAYQHRDDKYEVSWYYVSYPEPKLNNAIPWNSSDKYIARHENGEWLAYKESIKKILEDLLVPASIKIAIQHFLVLDKL